MRQESNNTFNGGLISDLNVLTTPNNVLTDCINGTFVTFNGEELTLQNDMGNTKIMINDTDYVKLSTGFKPIGIKEHGGILYIVSTDEQNVEIGSYPSPKKINSTLNKTVTLSNSDNQKTFPGLVIKPGDNMVFKLASFKFDDVENNYANIYNYISSKTVTGTIKKRLYKLSIYQQLASSLIDLTQFFNTSYDYTTGSGNPELYYWFSPTGEDTQVLTNRTSGNLVAKLELEDIDMFGINSYSMSYDANLNKYNIFFTFEHQTSCSIKVDSFNMIVNGLTTNIVFPTGTTIDDTTYYSIDYSIYGWDKDLDGEFLNFEIIPIFNYEVGDEYVNKYIVFGQFIIQEQSTIYFANEVDDYSYNEIFNIPVNLIKSIGDSVDYSGYICRGLFLLKNSLGEYIDENLQVSSEKHYIGYYDESVYLPFEYSYVGLNIIAYFKIPGYQDLLSTNPILCDINGVEITDPDKIVLKESFESSTPIFYDLSEANFTLDYKNYMYVTPTLETFQNYDNENFVNNPVVIPVDATNELNETTEVGLSSTILKYGKYTNISSINYNDTYGVLSSGIDNIFLTGNTSRKMFSPAKFSIFYGQHYVTDYAWASGIEEVPSLNIVKTTFYIICHSKFPQDFYNLHDPLKIPIHITIKRKNGNPVYSSVDVGIDHSNKPPTYTILQDNTKVDLNYYPISNPALVSINALEWNEYITYEKDALVKLPGTNYYYRSIADNNIGNNPSMSGWTGIPEVDNQLEFSDVFLAEVSFYEIETNPGWVPDYLYSPDYDVVLNFTDESYYKDFSNYFESDVSKLDFINTTGKTILDFGRDQVGNITLNPYLNGLVLNSQYTFDINSEPWIEYN